MIRVLIADDRKLLRNCLQALLTMEQDMQVVAQAGDGQEAVDLAKDLSPDVVLMDIRMPCLNGLEATRQILRQSHSQVLIVAMIWDAQMLHQALDTGARGYVSKLDAFAEVIPAVRAVHSGKSYFSKDTLAFLSPVAATAQN